MQIVSIREPKTCDGRILFRIVRRVRENAREDAARDTVAALHNDTVLVGLHKVLVEQFEPYLLEEFALAEFEDFSGCGLSKNAFISLLYRIREL